MNVVEKIASARRKGVPLIAVATSDQNAFIASATRSLNGSPQLIWDCSRGFTPLNKAGEAAIANLGDANKVRLTSANPTQAIGDYCPRFPADTVVYAMNVHRFLAEGALAAAFCQGIYNLRDIYKADHRTLVMLAPSFVFPAELSNDIILFEDRLPTDAEIREVVTTIADDSGAKVSDGNLRQAIPALRGLSAFGVEQIASIALKKSGVDAETAWERKVIAVGQIPGLTLSIGGLSFNSLGGLGGVKEFFRLLREGDESPDVYVFIDEIEKSFGGLGVNGGAGDNTGITQDSLMNLLTFMENEEADGMLMVGIPGSAKTASARAAAASADRPIITFDMGGMKTSRAGASEQAIRNALKVIGSIGSKGRIFFIATCNKLDVIPPELRRRFLSGIWYFDLPGDEEKREIWAIHRKAFGINESDVNPDDLNWTGAEIRNCCKMARKLKLPLKDAARYVIPVCQADPEAVSRLRESANGRFFDANTGASYKMNSAGNGSRRVALED